MAKSASSSESRTSAGDFYKSCAAAVEMLGKRATLLGGPDLQDSISLSSSNIFAAGYVPYSKILPLAKAVVHSGGIGTTGQALRAGHPMVVVPFSHDQLVFDPPAHRADEARRRRRVGRTDF